MYRHSGWLSFLNLSEAWPEMELRMPVLAGHSMYDPFITNEIVGATDRFADEFMQDSETLPLGPLE